MRTITIAALATIWLWRCAVPAVAETLIYTLTPQFGKGALTVELVWATGNRTQSVLRIAERWGQIDDVSGMIKGFGVIGGQAMRAEGGLYVVKHAPNSELTVRYNVEPGRDKFDDWRYSQHPITTKKFFHGVGTAFLITPNTGSNMPNEYEVSLRWRVESSHKAVASWAVGRTVAARLSVADLRDSVYFAGDLQIKKVDDGGRSVTVAMVDDFDFTLDSFAKMTVEIIRRQVEFMRETAFPDFVVTAIPVGEPLKEGDSRLQGSGLYNSFALWVAPGARLNDAVEHLFAHELFHFWNGRMLAARQPERLVYWFIEGFTDYYALRILYESGYWSAATYTKWVNRHLHEYYENPAMTARNDEIERDYWNKRNTVGEVAYQRGLLLGLRWHKLAKNNGVVEGFDKLFRLLVQRGRDSGLQVSNDSIRAAGVDAMGSWFGAEFDRYVTNAEMIDPLADALAPKLKGVATQVYAFELGWDAKRSLEKKKIAGLVKGSAAEQAGLFEGADMLGWNLHGDVDRKIKVTLRVGNKAREIEYYPRGKSRSMIQYRVAE